ncbi:MAG: response regulator [Deltaproteobacteria bacterium]|nr:response regulator [Deltaproteobacteria bacterium]
MAASDAPKGAKKKTATTKRSGSRKPAKATTSSAPVKTAKKATSEKPAKVASPTLSTIKLLVVDDEVEVLDLLVPFLKKRGYAVSQAEDGDQALEKILTERPNVVLLDVMMPGLNGWEISQYVRDRPELDPVRIIMATGIGEEMNAATAPLYGADAYIDKPFRLDEVERTVADVVARIASGAI